MAKKCPARRLPGPDASAADQAFGAARAFVEHMATLAYHARRFQPRPDKPEAWQDLAMTYALAFVAWFDLTHLLTPAVRTEARRVYPPGSPAIKLGKAKPTPTVIEAVADELGVYFRNTVYQDRRHPLEPDCERVAAEAKARATAQQVAQGKPAVPLGWGADFEELMKKETRAAVRERLGIKTLGDGWMLMVDEWKKQGRERAERALSLLRCGSIDFDDLQTQLIREAEAVIVAASKPNARTDAGGHNSISNTDTDWRDVQGRLLGKRERGEPYTSLRELAYECGCADATVRKAIADSDTLKGWQARSTGLRAAPKATGLGAVVRDNTRQTTEPAPDDVLPDDDVDALMARLIDRAEPEERAKLKALDDDGRRKLVAAYQSQNRDDEPSSSEPDKPGARPRIVRQHKRA